MSGYVYNERKTIRTNANVEKIYSTNKGFIGRLESVEYKQANDEWREQGSRWLINEIDPVQIMDNGFKSTKL